MTFKKHMYAETLLVVWYFSICLKNVKITNSASIFQFCSIFCRENEKWIPYSNVHFCGRKSKKEASLLHNFYLTWISQGTLFRTWQLTECDYFKCDTFVHNNTHLQRDIFMEPIFIIVISNIDNCCLH